MKRLVIDASVLVKLFFEEEHSDAAAKQMKAAREILAPDLIWAESLNVVWKRFRREEITAEDATGIADQILAFPIATQPSYDLAADALELAVSTGRTVYDCLYVALAIRAKCRLLTADHHLFKALAETPFNRHLRLLSAVGGGASIS